MLSWCAHAAFSMKQLQLDCIVIALALSDKSTVLEFIRIQYRFILLISCY